MADSKVDIETAVESQSTAALGHVMGWKSSKSRIYRLFLVAKARHREDGLVCLVE